MDDTCGTLIGGYEDNTYHERMLNLRDDGSFDLHAQWRGYENASVRGDWLRIGSQVHLSGRGNMRCCTWSFVDEPYERWLTVEANDDALMVACYDADVSPLWSMLAGPLAFVWKQREPLVEFRARRLQSFRLSDGSET